MDLCYGEKLYFDVAANLFRGLEGVGGKLKITNKRIYFQPHALNIQTSLLELYFEQISKAQPRSTYGIVPNGMSVFTKDGKEYRFVVWGRDRLITFINDSVGA
jgi:hypothetical protein